VDARRGELSLDAQRGLTNVGANVEGHERLAGGEQSLDVE
jgi:hypothetical protein